MSQLNLVKGIIQLELETLYVFRNKFLHLILYVFSERLSQLRGILLLITLSLFIPTLRALLFYVINFVWHPVKIWLKFSNVNSIGLKSDLYNLYRLSAVL